MQIPNKRKRKVITKTAAKLFATRAFHEVRLDDIAAAAGVGKGTLYVYFESKEDLYFSLIYEAFAAVVDRLRDEVAKPQASPAASLRAVVGHLVGFAFRHPHFYELMRTVGTVKGHSRSAWNAKRRELWALIEQMIRRGVRTGAMVDSHPQLTAPCIPGLVRSAMLFGPKGLDEKTVAGHIIRLLERGIVKKESK